MNDASKGTTSSSTQSLAHLIPVNVRSAFIISQHFMILQIQPPSLQNIVEMLNAFNNFIFLKIKPISVHSTEGEKGEEGRAEENVDGSQTTGASTATKNHPELKEEALD